MIRDSIPSSDKRLSLVQIVGTVSKAHPESHSKEDDVHVGRGSKRQGRELNHSAPCSAEIKINPLKMKRICFI
jgi:hypothetical protein